MAGKIVHFELPAKDAGRARRFYTELFGWKWHDSGMPDMEYQMSDDPGATAAIYADPDQRGPIVYFDVDDIDGAIRKIKSLGGKAEDKAPIPSIGWFSHCADTEGNAFSLFQDDRTAPMPETANAASARS